MTRLIDRVLGGAGKKLHRYLTSMLGKFFVYTLAQFTMYAYFQEKIFAGISWLTISCVFGARFIHFGYDFM